MLKPIDLKDHPEGGRFLEVFRSDAVVTQANGKLRSALTHIYFSLNHGEVSRFHKVSSDEVWNLYQGEGLLLYSWESLSGLSCTELSARNNCYCSVIPAGIWQAAEPIGDEVLVGCSVGPGFEFEDFELIHTSSPVAKSIIGVDPALHKFI